LREKILVVDHYIFHLKLLRELFAERGYEVACSHNVRDAFCQIRLMAEKPDLVVFGPFAQGMEFYDVRSMLRDDPRTAETAVIVLAALDDADAEARTFAVGGEVFGEAEFLARVRAQLSIRTMNRQLLAMNQQLEDEIVERDRAEAALATMNRQLLAMNQQLEDEIVERDRAEAALAEMNRELERKVRERTAQVENLLLQKDQFIHQLSHDLKTPLTPILTLLALLEKESLAPDLAPLISVGLQNARHMKELIHRVLRLARLNSSQPNLQISRLDFGELVRETLGRCAFEAERKSLAVRADLPDSLFLEGDRTMLGEAVENILANAIRYTSQGGIFVELAACGEHARLSVRDTGDGIEREHFARIFNEFYKLDASRHDRSSTGLGLSITRRIVEHHLGEIHVESEGRGRGSTFTIVLPLRQKANEEAQA
jgi:signal transduction histidine kinase